MKKYFFYGSSILFSRGLEYLILLIAPFYLTKENYGSLEFYKKIIELGAAMLTFGLPTLIMTYPKSNESKKYFTVISLLFITTLAVLVTPLLSIFNYLFLLIPIYFHSVFFNNGIVAPFILTYKGSNYASLYKSIISLVFYSTVLISIFYFDKPNLAFVYVNYLLLPLILVYTIFFIYKNKIVLRILKKYWVLFKKLIFSSLTIVVSNFANMMFLYTDILIIKILSNSADVEIANYSFSLNIANALIIIPLTLVQVDIEKLKKNLKYARTLRVKIFRLVLIMTVALVFIFIFLTHFYFEAYSSVLYVFLIILGAKFIQALSVSYGAVIIIRKLFSQNLVINLFALSCNVVLSYFLYSQIGLMGIAVSSLATLLIRFVLLLKLNNKV
ncbi:oligosaccharide flippase family protein [uncultured Winogradskyella sp.]|uniref:oligosaccharide flippase family protein n=1 Tax=Winogradskyella sp. 4-2091 TaxID=3381659 RepID=UPI00260B78DD|nr:oligosaccharide flippase family protein [uncultured Winogradskyella sp.]